MTCYLNLNDHATRDVLSRFNLTPANRIGRGMFCAVYDAGEQDVWKLTADSIQLESVRDYLCGPYFPEVRSIIGYVGEQRNEASLFLFKSEKLRKIQEADAATRKLARLLVKTAGVVWTEVTQDRACKSKDYGVHTVRRLADARVLPSGLREAFEDAHSMFLNYDKLLLDIHGNNLMVRGSDQLVLNDIVVDGEKTGYYL